MGKVFTGAMAEKYSDVTNGEKWECLEFYTKVAGVTFVPQEYVEDAKTGDFIVILPDVGNKYDKFACAVMHDRTGNRLGYLKSELAKDVWENIQKRGHLYIGKLEKTGGGDKQTGLNLTLKHFKPKG